MSKKEHTMKTFNPNRLNALAAGTVIRVPDGGYDHVGMLSDIWRNGERLVMSFSRQAGGFLEEPFSSFAKGRPVTIDGYLGSLPPAAVMALARAKRGTAYVLSTFNCEHFVRYAHGVKTESPQLQGAVFLGLLGLATWFAARA